MKQKSYQIIKRIFDVIVSALGLILLSPLLLILAILVRINLGTPVFFRQERPGLNEKIFTLYKFRSMKNAADSKGNLLPDEARLSGFGKILRASSLDELPEFARASMEVMRQPIDIHMYNGVTFRYSRN